MNYAGNQSQCRVRLPFAETGGQTVRLRTSTRPSEKGITESEFEKAYGQLVTTGHFDRKWFNKNFGIAALQSPCNFRAMGGVFVMLGMANYRRGEFSYLGQPNYSLGLWFLLFSRYHVPLGSHPPLLEVTSEIMKRPSPIRSRRAAARL